MPLSKFSSIKKKFLLSLGFLFTVILFIAGSGASTYAKDLGFGPALIDTANCLIGSAPCSQNRLRRSTFFNQGPIAPQQLHQPGS